LEVELARQVLKRLGCETRLLNMPFARALAELEAGRLDILPGAYRRPEREVYAHFSRVLMHSRNLLYTRAAERERVGTRPLTELVAGGFRLGAQIGVVYGPEYAELMREPTLAGRVQKGASRQGLWQMLARGRIDGLIADEATAAYELRQLGLLEQVTSTDKVVSSEVAGSAFSKRSVDAAFVARHDAALQAMQKDGSLAALLARYGLKP
jgi:polar amino acid transport system substrate-binding protein